MVANDDDYYEPNQITKHHVSQFKGRADSEAWSTWYPVAGGPTGWRAAARSRLLSGGRSQRAPARKKPFTHST
jgi:hypothetical protein